MPTPLYFRDVAVPPSTWTLVKPSADASAGYDQLSLGIAPNDALASAVVRILPAGSPAPTTETTGLYSLDSTLALGTLASSRADVWVRCPVAVTIHALGAAN